MQVVKNHPDWPNPYNGITAIRHGDIDRDVGIYLAESEQRSCALAAVSLDRHVFSDEKLAQFSESNTLNSIVFSNKGTAWNGILCTAAGGYLVERLPDW